MSEKEKAEERTPMTALQSVDGAPAPEVIEQWKIEHGEVFIFMPSQKECYVWRPVLRAEFTKLQEDTATNGFTELQSEEKLLDQVVLWPVDIDWAKKKAGTASTLVEQVMYNSHFLPAQAAAAFVAQL